MMHTTRRQLTEAKDEGVVLDDCALSRNPLLVPALQAKPKVVRDKNVRRAVDAPSKAIDLRCWSWTLRSAITSFSSSMPSSAAHDECANILAYISPCLRKMVKM